MENREVEPGGFTSKRASTMWNRRRQGKKPGTDRGTGIGVTVQGKDLRVITGTEPVQAEGKRGWRDGGRGGQRSRQNRRVLV